MKHRMQQSLNDLEMHRKNSLFVGGRDGIGLMKAEAPAGPEDLSAKKARTGKIKGTACPHPIPVLLLPSPLSGPGGGSSLTGPVWTHGQRHCVVTAGHTGPLGHMQLPRASSSPCASARTDI